MGMKTLSTVLSLSVAILDKDSSTVSSADSRLSHKSVFHSQVFL